MAPAPILPAPALAIVDPVIQALLATGKTISPPGGKKRRGATNPRAIVEIAEKSRFMRQPKRGVRGGPDLPAPGPPGPAGPVGFGFIGRRPSRRHFLRASLGGRRGAFALSPA